jgi:hypothetical protein
MKFTKVSDGPERVTVADIDALLYLPGHSREKLESSLRIPALSPGWKSSFEALLNQGASNAGNAGLDRFGGFTAPAWSWLSATACRKGGSGEFQCDLAVFSNNWTRSPSARGASWTISCSCGCASSSDGAPLLRNYSMSGRSGRGRISGEREIRSEWRCQFVPAQSCKHAGDALEVSAPSGGFYANAARKCVLSSWRAQASEPPLYSRCCTALAFGGIPSRGLVACTARGTEPSILSQSRIA